MSVILSTLSDPLFLATLVGIFAFIFFHSHSATTSKTTRLPPGPKGHWLWGYTIPKVFAYRHFESLSQVYGPAFTLRTGPSFIPFLSKTRVIVGRVDAAVSILERQGAATADRPRSISAGETLSGGMRVLLTPAGDRFRKLRKALHSHLQPSVVKGYAHVQERHAKKNILNCQKDNERHQDHAKLYSAALVMSLAYGREDTASYEDPTVQSVNRCLTRLGVTLRPGVWKVDTIPFLRYLPGYLDELREGHREELGLFKTELDLVRARLADTNLPPLPPCFGSYCLEKQAELGLSDDEIAYLAGSMFGAGSDTTASAISVTVLASVLYPQYQHALRRELVRYLSSSNSPDSGLLTRPPTFDDIDADAFPRLTAFVWETYRWRPVTAGGFSHKATKDVIYNEYVIPAGTEIIGNVWAVSRDPEYFPDPERFDPSRWLEPADTSRKVGAGDAVFVEDGEVKLREDLKSKALYTFGFGRRVCPGQWMALRSTLINCALYHWAFDILPYEKDPEAWPIDPLDFTPSANAHPSPFKVTFKDRLGGKLDELLEGYGDE